MGFFPSYFFSYLFIHTQKKSLQHYSMLSFQIWKRSHFYLSYFKERTETFEEGAINLERQTHFNEM